MQADLHKREVENGGIRTCTASYICFSCTIQIKVARATASDCNSAKPSLFIRQIKGFWSSAYCGTNAHLHNSVLCTKRLNASTIRSDWVTYVRRMRLYTFLACSEKIRILALHSNALNKRISLCVSKLARTTLRTYVHRFDRRPCSNMTPSCTWVFTLVWPMTILEILGQNQMRVKFVRTKAAISKVKVYILYDEISR